MEKTIDEPKARPDVGCTELFGVSVGRVDGFRSQPAVNTDEDMVRVVLDMPKPTWRKLKKLLPPNATLHLPTEAQRKGGKVKAIVGQLLWPDCLLVFMLLGGISFMVINLVLWIIQL